MTISDANKFKCRNTKIIYKSNQFSNVIILNTVSYANTEKIKE